MRLYEDIEIRRIDEKSSIVHIPKTDRYIKMGNKEIEFLETFYSDINKSQASANYNSLELLMLDKFKELKLIGEKEDVEEEKFKTRFQIKDISKIKLISLNVDKVLNFLKPLGERLFTFKAAVAFFIIWIISVCMFFLDGDYIAEQLINVQDLGVTDLIAVYFMMIISLIIHEFCHGMACVRFGGKVKKVGIMLFYFQLAAYCDVSGIYFIDKKYKKVITFLAGILSQLIISSFVFIIYYILSKIGYNISILLYFVIVNVTIAIFNLFPFVKLDGYWILSSVLNVYNLRTKSFEYLVAIIIGKFNVIKEKRIYKVIVAYGVCAVFATFFMWLMGITGALEIIKGYISERVYQYILYSSITFLIIFMGKGTYKYIKKVKNVY